jgi:hypothetical protein
MQSMTKMPPSVVTTQGWSQRQLFGLVALVLISCVRGQFTRLPDNRLVFERKYPNTSQHRVFGSSNRLFYRQRDVSCETPNNQSSVCYSTCFLTTATGKRLKTSELQFNVSVESGMPTFAVSYTSYASEQDSIGTEVTRYSLQLSDIIEMGTTQRYSLNAQLATSRSVSVAQTQPDPNTVLYRSVLEAQYSNNAVIRAHAFVHSEPSMFNVTRFPGGEPVFFPVMAEGVVYCMDIFLPPALTNGTLALDHTLTSSQPISQVNNVSSPQGVLQLDAKGYAIWRYFPAFAHQEFAQRSNATFRLPYAPSNATRSPLETDFRLSGSSLYRSDKYVPTTYCAELSVDLYRISADYWFEYSVATSLSVSSSVVAIAFVCWFYIM